MRGRSRFDARQRSLLPDNFPIGHSNRERQGAVLRKNKANARLHAPGTNLLMEFGTESYKAKANGPKLKIILRDPQLIADLLDIYDVPPQTKLDTLGHSSQACVNSAGSGQKIILSAGNYLSSALMGSPAPGDQGHDP